MRTRKSYKKYEPWVKAAISMTGLPDLFQELGISRTTAKYWITKQYSSDDPVVQSLTEVINQVRLEINSCRSQLAEQEALTKLFEKTVVACGFKLRWKHVHSKETKFEILDALADALKVSSRRRCLELIGLSLSRYKKWRRERRGCGLVEMHVCPRGSNRLTFRELQVMKNLVTSKDFAHFPIISLHFYAKREKILFCSYSTWRKYIDLYKWKRPRKKPRVYERKIGIRAKRPNEIWHLDLSYFVLPNKTKLYIQAVVDNYSRYVIAWQVLDSYDGSKTAHLLKMALERTLSQKPKTLRLIVDGGGENRSHHVSRLEGKGHFEKLVAKFEISFSNSIVETLFRSMKHNYLFHQQILNHSSLRRHVDFWIKEHNEKIPHSSFSGETPSERFKKHWSKENVIRIFVGQKEALKLRIRENQKISCHVCDER